jgi:imidazolonepropionase-like amidohydrolase
MATAALLREALFKAGRYAKGVARADAGEEDKRPDFDMKLEALRPVMALEIPLKIHAHRADDMLTAIRVCEEFGLRYTLDHATEGYRIVDALLEAMNGTQRRGRLEGVIVGPLMLDRSKPELRNSDARNPGILAAHGIPVAIMTDHPCIPIQHLLLSAAMAVREGMDEEAALRAVTIHAARVCGMQDRVGSLAPGKDADIAIFTGHPLDMRTKVRCTIVGGLVVHGS